VADADDTSSNVSISWYKNGVNQTSLAAAYAGLGSGTATIVSTINASNLAKGDNWSCMAIAFDGANYSSANFSSNVTIQNSAPFILHATAFAYAPNHHDFNATAGVLDADGGLDIASSSISSNATACSYLGNSTSGNAFNATFNCTASGTAEVNITFTDSSGASISASPAQSEFNNTAPSVTQPSISPSSPNKTSTLICSNGAFSDINGDFELFSEYRWYVNGSLILQPFMNATTLGNSSFNKGDNISCSQTPFDEHGLGGAANMSANVTIQNSLPEIAFQVAFANATAGHSFTATAGATDPDGVSDISGASISDAACNFLSNHTSGSEFNATFNCTSAFPATSTSTITFNDSSGASAATSPSSNSYPDNAPSLGQPIITPSSPNKTSTLSCNNGAFSDLDGDIENSSAIAWAWYRNGTIIPGQASATLAPAYFNKSDAINCSETSQSQNWSAYTASNASDAATIQNSAPAIPSSLSPAGGEAFTDPSSISISWPASTDPDNDSIFYLLDYSADSGATWQSIIPSAASSPYSWAVSSLGAGATYRIRIAANDSTSISAYAQSADFAIARSAPAPSPESSNGGGNVYIPPTPPAPAQQPPATAPSPPQPPSPSQQPNASQGSPTIIVPQNMVAGQQVEIKALDAAGAPLAGKDIQVTMPDGSEVTLITGLDGSVSFTADLAGIYRFELAGAPSASSYAALPTAQPPSAQPAPSGAAPSPQSASIPFLALAAIGIGVIAIAGAILAYLAFRKKRGL
jgi:hypothetical protein